MPAGLVTIKSPTGRDIFINGAHARPAGKSPGPFVVEFGPNTFETLDEKLHVDFRGDATLDELHSAVEISLAPTNPAAPIAALPASSS